VLIDSSGTNPFSTSEMATLARFIASSSIEPVLVTPAGGDVEESAEIAESFRAVGARRFILTRVDMTRRFGAALVAASAGPLSFSEVSISPHVARGLSGLNSNSLARLLLRDPYRTDANGATRKVAK
jgi:flagellar biosynthesis protein FlhF